MTITRKQVADLREGDVVERHYDEFPDAVTRGPLRRATDGRLWLAGEPVVEKNGAPTWNGFVRTLTVVSRVPRLYVNHPRTEPVPGDVVSRGDKDGATWSYCPRPIQGMGYRWRNTANDEWFATEDFLAHASRLRLLVDGETGQVVP